MKNLLIVKPGFVGNDFGFAAGDKTVVNPECQNFSIEKNRRF
jgi:hypothetical protein